LIRGGGTTGQNCIISARWLIVVYCNHLIARASIVNTERSMMYDARSTMDSLLLLFIHYYCCCYWLFSIVIIVICLYLFCKMKEIEMRYDINNNKTKTNNVLTYRRHATMAAMALSLHL